MTKLSSRSRTTVSGCPSGLNWKLPNPLGLQVVRALIGQLHGDLRVDGTCGVNFKFGWKALASTYNCVTAVHCDVDWQALNAFDASAGALHRAAARTWHDHGLRYSRMQPQFNRETPERDLLSHGIAYRFFGQEPGARSDNPDCYRDGKVQYDRIAETALFQYGLKLVVSGMKELPGVAPMCAEKEPLEWHRTILIARHLAAQTPIWLIKVDSATG